MDNSALGCYTARHTLPCRGPLAAFLDHVADDPLYALWWLIALRGLRRGEAAGLRWHDIDLDRGN